MEKTFLLGVGCQKGGTSWLHNYLSKHPNTNMGFAKEYHIFDALTIPACERHRDEKSRYSFVFKDMKYKLWPRRLLGVKLRREFYSDTGKYFDYFDRIAEPSDGVTLTGDITPSYAGLSPEVYKEIKDGAEARGFRVKVIFLMRDPVERCI